VYGRALLKRVIAAFDELKQGIGDIEFLADPNAGEVRVGCTDSIAGTVLAPVIQSFYQKYPRVVLHLHRLVTPNLELPELRERTLDVVIARAATPVTNEDVNVEILFDDRIVVTAGTQSRWARRHKIDLADLVDEPWILTPPDGLTRTLILDAFHARGLDIPKVCITTHSIHVRAILVATGPFITALPNFLVRAERFPLTALPIDLPVPPWPVAIVTLKNRTLSPVAQLFTDHVRAFTKSIGGELKPIERSA
jgi:DNA-binding transcriptional LysR family regulator